MHSLGLHMFKLKIILRCEATFCCLLIKCLLPILINSCLVSISRYITKFEVARFSFLESMYKSLVNFAELFDFGKLSDILSSLTPKRFTNFSKKNFIYFKLMFIMQHPYVKRP